MSPQATSMLNTAREYCELIESIDRSGEAFLARLSELLPRLHAAVAAIEQQIDDEGEPMQADLDARFELFSRLHELLGERDAYWMEFDAGNDGQQMSGSLADDLTDIYCELKHGLGVVEISTDPVPALRNWRSGYRVHWGKHLVDAERHLYELSARNLLSV
jgi:hypothetical protein